MHKIYNITPCQPEFGLLFLVFLQKKFAGLKQTGTAEAPPGGSVTGWLISVSGALTQKSSALQNAERSIVLRHYPLTEPAVTPLMMYLLRQI